ncbi:unnamed protein product [Didymodactylos carnosus]|uniref:J domain-containing protein n=1 Tax=Didymodactylos carnosus TaxID=1234261 RepID=A0A8S2CYJ5_9BILA|nr:unnamed protein product [Didymodactylos carnosus]CAF3621912.1 unnamed protein product [Didymodactylos carnosus]
MDLKEYQFKVLDIDPNSSVEDVKKAYKRKVLEYHPDKNPNNPNAKENFQLIQKAYEILSKDEESGSQVNYDSDDSNEDFTFEDGTKISNEYRSKIKKWIEEYNNDLIIEDNFTEELITITSNLIAKFGHLEQISTKYVECDVCHQTFLNVINHREDVVSTYTSLFDNPFIPRLDALLRKKIHQTIWYWNPTTPQHTNLLCSNEWNQLVSYVEQIIEPIQIVTNPPLYNVYLDRTSELYKSIDKLASLLASAEYIKYLPDRTVVQSLRHAFDNKNMSQMSTKNNDNGRSPSGSKVNMFEHKQTILNNYMDANDLYYIVQTPPDRVQMWTQRECNICEKKFNIFRRKSHCQMCGTLQCKNCQSLQTIPHLGYIYPVKICKKCIEQRLKIDIKILMNYVIKRMLNIENTRIGVILALIQSYNYSDTDTFFQTVGTHFSTLKNYTLALQAYSYARLDCSEWFKFAFDACTSSNYALLLTCINTLTKLYKKDKEFWIEKSDEYEKMSNSTSTINEYTILSLVCYEYAETTSENLLKICFKYDKSDQCDKCLFYLLYLNKTIKINWNVMGQKLLKESKNHHRLVMFFFQLAELSTDSWIDILNILCTEGEYNKVALLLNSLDKLILCELNKSHVENHVLYCLLKMLVNESVDDWLCDVVSLKSNTNTTSRTVWCLAFIHVSFKVESWITLRNHYFRQKQNDKWLLCHKMGHLLNEPTDEMLVDAQMLEENEQLAFEILSLSANTDWRMLGDDYFEKQNYHLALSIYLQQNDDDIFRYLLLKAQCLTDEGDHDTAILYNTAVYKKNKKNYDLLPTVIHSICRLLLIKAEDVVDILISTMKVYHCKSNKLNLYKLHLLLINELSEPTCISGGIHFLNNTYPEKKNTELDALTISINEHINRMVGKNIRYAIEHGSFTKLAQQLTQINNAQILRIIVDEKNLGILPNNQRAMTHLIRAQISKLENNSLEVVKELEQALLCYYSTDETLIDAVVLLLKNVSIQHRILTDITNLNLNLKSNVDFIDPLMTPTIISNIALPKLCVYTQALKKSNHSLNLIRKYEKSILKRSDHLNLAFTYFDMCTTTQNSTSMIANFVMASIHFYQLMNSTCSIDNIAEIYAYRNTIVECCSIVYFMAKRRVGPHMQIYFYKLAITLIIKSNQILKRYLPKQKGSTQVVILKTQSLFITKVLEDLVTTCELAPLTELPTSGTFDTLYMDLIGANCLSKCLEQMETIYSQYLLFSGICNGWIDDKKFDTYRLNCMNSLLDTRQWTMNDVQLLLDYSLVPRTNDGWLTNTVQPLNIHGKYTTNDTNGNRSMFKDTVSNEKHVNNTIVQIIKTDVQCDICVD